MSSVRIPLNSRKYPGLFAIIDEEDYGLVSQHRWRPMNRAHCFYARSNSGPFMHRLILSPPPGYVVDHINHDGLDNRRSNIRVVTVAQNNHNTRAHISAKSRFKNVTVARDRWRATGRVDGKNIVLGTFLSEELAARVADQYHRSVHGEHGYLNFRDDLPDSYLEAWIRLDHDQANQLFRDRLKGNTNWRGTNG